MKKITALLLLLSQFAYAQQWVNMMRDPSVNFYETQKAFNQQYQQHLKKENKWYKKLAGVFSKETEKEIPGYEVYRRWENFMEPRVYPSGRRFPADMAWKEFHNYCSRFGINSSNVAGNWTPLGPSSWLTNSYNPGIGRVNVVAVDPNNSDIIFIGAPQGGLWKSSDAGQTWNTTTDHLPSIGVSGIAIDPSNSNTIYIGTGDGDAGDNYGVGVLKSTDGGVTWDTTGLSWSKTQVRNVTKLLINPVNPQIIFATTGNGVYKTTDGGINWSIVITGSYRDIEFQPGNYSIVYAAGTKFMRSQDGGNTFTQITSGLPISSNVNHLVIGVTPADPQYVYVAAGDNTNSGFYGMYRSVDGGLTFTQQSNSPNLYGYATDGTDAGGQSWYSMTISVSPVNKNEVYTGGVNIWRSTDGGVTWNIITHWFYDTGGSYPYVHADQHAMDFFGNILYVGCDGGVFYSDDFGDTWNDITAGMAITEFYRIGASATDPTKIMAGAQDNGCNFYDNGQWTHVLGADGMETAIDPVNSNTLYACGQGGWLNRSDDAGLTMNDITTGSMTGGNWITPYMLDPNNHNTIYAGYSELWKSTNQGNNWTQISSFGGPGGIDFLNVAQSNSNYIYVLTDNILYRTTNGGSTWNVISDSLPNGAAAMTSIAIDPNNADRIWVSFSGSSAANKVFYSPDAGTTWSNITINLLNVPVNSIVYQNNSPDGLYVGTDVGVFYNDTTLSNWQPFWNGLPNVVITELEINYVNNKIRAATYGRGLWESDLYVQLTTPPDANFTVDKTEICPGESVQFADNSTNAAPGWMWSFPGGNPSGSALPNPVVTYPSPGTYNVSLSVSNPFGSDTLIKNNYITVSIPAAQAAPFYENFEAAFPAPQWKIINPDNGTTWIQNADAGGYGLSTASVSIDNYYYNKPGESDILLTGSYDLTTIPQPQLNFDLAYAIFPTYADTLKVFYTADCGLTRTYIFNKGGDSLATVPPVTSPYTPAAGDWVTYHLVLDTTISAMTGVQFGFENINGYGNTLFLDNINLNNITVGLNEINLFDDVSVYPCPFTSQINISLPRMSDAKSVEINIMNTIGEKVLYMNIPFINNLQLDAKQLADGIYTLLIKAGNKSYVRKLVKME